MARVIHSCTHPMWQSIESKESIYPKILQDISGILLVILAVACCYRCYPSTIHVNSRAGGLLIPRYKLEGRKCTWVSPHYSSPKTTQAQLGSSRANF